MSGEPVCCGRRPGDMGLETPVLCSPPPISGGISGLLLLWGLVLTYCIVVYF